MPLISEVLGALVAGGLAIAAAKQLGIEGRRVMGAVALVPIAVGGLLALPALRDAAEDLLDQRAANAALSMQEAQLQPGVEVGVNVTFLEWVKERLSPGDTFHLVIGENPDDERVGGVSLRQATILQWSLFQLAPHLAFEQSAKARDTKLGQGHNADWLVFYEMDPAEYRGARLRDVMTWAPGFAIARGSDAR